MANPRAGKVLQGRYRLRQILAEGGMGIVWQAERVGIERPVVVKFLQAVFSDRPGAVDRFEREARATARLNHPHCVQLVDFGLDEQQPYLVVEFVEGQTLAEILDHGPLDAKRAVRIVIQVLSGLEHAHERGILHRDLKPANLMIIEAAGYVDFVKILDFGLAKIIGEADRREVTVHGVALGTPGYMSPEQAAGMPSDLRADIYSVGAVLYHLLTGVKVFEGGNVHSILRKHRENTPAPPRKLRGPGAISAELDAVVTRALERDPERRLQSAAAMRAALEGTPEGARAPVASAPGRAFSKVDEEGATRVASRAGRPLPRRQRRGASWPLAIGLGVAGVVVGGGSAVMWLRGAHVEVPHTTEVVANVDAALPTPNIEVTSLDPAATVDAAIAVVALHPAADLTATENIDDGSNEDQHEPPAPPSEAPQRPARDVHNIADVRALVRRGETDLAISGLYALRRRGGMSSEREAEVATLLGHLYSDRKWNTDALREYRYALGLDVHARSDQTIINNTVRALGDPETAPRARRVLIDSVGRAAIPALRRALERTETHDAAADVLAKLGAR
jgi:serine/threonine-protein kinase